MAPFYSHYQLPYKNIHLYLSRLSSGNPEATNLLVLPMTGSNGGFLAPFGQEMANCGFQVWMLDFMGHGRSSGIQGIFTMEELIGNVQEAVNFIQEQSETAIVVMGTHLGSEVAFHSALEDPRIGAVICHNLLLASELSFNWLMRLAKSPLAPVLTRAFLPWLELEKIFDHQLLFENPELLAKFHDDPLRVRHYEAKSYLSVFNWRPKKPLSEMSAPVLLICGEKGRLIPLKHQKRVYQKLSQRGVDVGLAVLPGAGNQILLEQTTVTAKLVKDWSANITKEEAR